VWIISDHEKKKKPVVAAVKQQLSLNRTPESLEINSLEVPQLINTFIG
jgi:hypothetical protein